MAESNIKKYIKEVKIEILKILYEAGYSKKKLELADLFHTFYLSDIIISRMTHQQLFYETLMFINKEKYVER